MSYLPQVAVGEGFEPFDILYDNFGLIPNIFRAQTLLPRLIEAQLHIVKTILLKHGALARPFKERIALTIAARRRNEYCVAMHAAVLQRMGGLGGERDGPHAHPSDSSGSDSVLLDFAVKLGQSAPSVSADQIEHLQALGFSDQQILEAVLTAALSTFFCTLSVGLGVAPDFRLTEIPRTRSPKGEAIPRGPKGDRTPFIRTVELSAESFAPFAFLAKVFGFVPNMLRAHTLRPDVVEAEVEAIRLVLLPDDVLQRVQKENILLVLSAANLNTYCVAAHCELLRGLGVSVERSDQIAVDHRQANLPAHEEALLDFALKLAIRPAEYGVSDVEHLGRCGFSDQQILETIAMCGFTQFLNVSSVGLGAEPDFQVPPLFRAAQKKLHLPPVSKRLMEDRDMSVAQTAAEIDPDGELVARVQRGEAEAFEELVRRHSQRVYRTLAGMLGQAEEAEDAAQEVFINAYRNIAEFEGRSKFSTWLMRIAVNRGLQRLRSRRPLESMDSVGGDERFQPANVQPWQENPEQIYSRAEAGALIEKEIMKLPVPYRVAVMLRDMQGLSTEEAAAAAGISVPALKTRLLRGRLMLREALSKHLSKGEVTKSRD